MPLRSSGFGSWPVTERLERKLGAAASMVLALLCCPAAALGGTPPLSPTNIFSPDSTPAHSIFRLSLFELEIEGAIFVVVFSLLAYAVTKFRQKRQDDGTEPPQVYGSNQMELAWTVLPVLIVVVLFLTTAQVIHRVQDAQRPAGAIEVTVVGHQYWWEYRYPQYDFVAANELHVPVSSAQHPTPTFLGLLSADTDHSFWVPRLAGKTDLIPNHPNSTWIDPQETGLFLGQCSQYCGTQHAKMLQRVYVQSREDFDRWANEQKKDAVSDPAQAAGAALFISKACFACHTIRGTIARGVVGPDLTHLMSRDTAFKPGSLMPAPDLTDQELDQIVGYLLTLK